MTPHLDLDELRRLVTAAYDGLHEERLRMWDAIYPQLGTILNRLIELEASEANFLTYGEGGAGYWESQYLDRLRGMEERAGIAEAKTEEVIERAMALLTARCEIHTGKNMTWADFLISGGDACPVCFKAERDLAREHEQRLQTLVQEAFDAESEPFENDDIAYCGFCSAEGWEPLTHSPECWIVRARAVLASGEGGGHMSTDWGYHCNDCNVDSDTWINHGDAELAAIARYWPALRAINDDPDINYLEIRWLSGYTGELLEFLYEHGEHNICLLNEYGVHKAIMVSLASTAAEGRPG